MRRDKSSIPGPICFALYRSNDGSCRNDELLRYRITSGREAWISEPASMLMVGATNGNQFV